MQNGAKTTMSMHRTKSSMPFANRSKRGTPNVARPDLRGSQDAQKNYERYLALAQAQAQSGDRIGAENYYQHAEHYFRSMRSEREMT
jgi:hypothetical protein